MIAHYVLKDIKNFYKECFKNVLECYIKNDRSLRSLVRRICFDIYHLIMVYFKFLSFVI